MLEDRDIIAAIREIPDGGRSLEQHLILTLAEQLEAVEERVAAALFEKAMEERRVFGNPGQFTKGWYDEPYVGPVREGENRRTDWRDDWREDARRVLGKTARGL